MESSHNFDFGPLVGLVVFAVIVVIVIDYLTKVGGVGSGIDLERIGDHISELRARRQRKPEDMKTALLRRIKTVGIVAALFFALAAFSFAYMIGAILELYETTQGDVNMALSGLILGAVLTTVYSLQFINNKRLYEKYYGSLFKQK